MEVHLLSQLDWWVAASFIEGYHISYVNVRYGMCIWNHSLLKGRWTLRGECEGKMIVMETAEMQDQSEWD